MPNFPISGVLNGSQTRKLFEFAKLNNFAIPAVNVTSSNTINAALESAKKANSPIIIQFSNGGASFLTGKTLSNENEKSAILGAILGAKYVHALAKEYQIPVVLHTDHASAKLLPWIDGLLEASQEEFDKTGQALFSSHMLDLSAETLDENLRICSEYLEKMKKLDILLEIELGVTGGEEDGVDNSDVDNAKLYTQPSDVALAFETLNKTINIYRKIHPLSSSNYFNGKLTKKIIINNFSYS